jgi:asparagine synthase (glutamine-hydrolysing)
VSGFFFMRRLDETPVEIHLLETIAKALTFRGPDGSDVWANGSAGGCFTWMQTDPAKQAAHQPAGLHSRFWLWGDIRLDAREELRSKIAENGQTPAPDLTGEELLLRAWRQQGEASLKRLLGDFSFVLWDATEQAVWCARDFVGARPFYYAHTEKLFCCSNTLDILPLVPEISRDLDEQFIADFLLDGWSADLSRTVYQGIRRLPPGHLLKLAQHGPEVRRFRQLPIEEPLRWKRAEDYIEAYVHLLRVAVKERLPEGATALYLSGGLDSSAVCAMSAQITGEDNRAKLKAFTVSWNPFFDDPEPAFANLTAKHLAIAHEVLQEEDLTLFEGIETADGRIPEPSEQIFFLRDRRMYIRIAAHSSVVLSGDGGDDVLTGQGWPYLMELKRKGDWTEAARAFGGYFWTHWRIPPLRGGFRTKLHRLLKPRKPFAGYPEWFNASFEKRTNLRQRWLELQHLRTQPEHPVHPEAYTGLHAGYWSRVLEAEDAGWCRVLLEPRAPLLDLRVLEFSLRLPPVPWCMNKELCRRAMKSMLPKEIVQRAKTPLRKEPLEVCRLKPEFLSALRNEPHNMIEAFVKWDEWCETLLRSKGSLNWVTLRPLSLLHWAKAVETR